MCRSSQINRSLRSIEQSTVDVWGVRLRKRAAPRDAFAWCSRHFEILPDRCSRLPTESPQAARIRSGQSSPFLAGNSAHSSYVISTSGLVAAEQIIGRTDPQSRIPSAVDSKPRRPRCLTKYSFCQLAKSSPSAETQAWPSACPKSLTLPSGGSRRAPDRDGWFDPRLSDTSLPDTGDEITGDEMSCVPARERRGLHPWFNPSGTPRNACPVVARP